MSSKQSAVPLPPPDIMTDSRGVSDAETMEPTKERAGDTGDDTADDAKGETNIDSEKTDDNKKTVSCKDEPPKQEYMTGLPFYITFGSLMMAALLAALNASMIATYTFIAFIFVFEIGNLIAGVAISSPMLIIGRAITGIGGSGLVTGATSIITTIRPLEKRPMLIGTIMGGVAIGQVGGPLIGGALSQVSWRWVFYILKKLQALAQGTAVVSDDNAGPIKLTFRQHFDISMKQLARIDFPGFLIFAAACALFLIGLEWGGTKYPWNSATVIGLLVGGAVLFSIFGAWSQYLGDRALLPFRLLRYGHVNIFCGLTSLTQAASVFILMSYLPIWFQGVKGATPIVSGVMLLPTIVSQLVAALLCGFLVQRTGYYLPEVIGGNSFVAIASGLFTTFSPSTNTGEWIGYQILGGAGRGFVMQLLTTVIQANVPPSDIPLGVSYVMFCQYFGGAVAICAARVVLTSTIGVALAQYAPTVDAATVINTGVTDLRSVIPASEITGVIIAYNKALVNVYYLQLSLSLTALICSCFLGWRDIRKPRAVQSEKTDVEVVATEEKNETK
ncbi:hypothetical protein SEUCBS139899_004503 [Sporothrix eucalyptigena]